MAIDIIEQYIADISVDLLKILLSDKTTGRSIKWATDNYSKYGKGYESEQEILPELIIGPNTHIIQPRVAKALIEQTKRTRDKAEVFTPSWVCNEQNNLIDEAWFKRKNVFNCNTGSSWKTNEEPITFSVGRTWQQYVDARRLEMSCGEAPYLVSRYDAVSGKEIPPWNRIGLLDRKMRVVNENVANADEWQKWATRAFQSVYGYEYQGDNVLLARENLLLTYIDNYNCKFGQKPTLKETKKIATIISWNIWQMDGITLLPPFYKEAPTFDQMTLLEFSEPSEEQQSLQCKIYDWRAHHSLEFRSMMSGGTNRG